MLTCLVLTGVLLTSPSGPRGKALAQGDWAYREAISCHETNPSRSYQEALEQYLLAGKSGGFDHRTCLKIAQCCSAIGRYREALTWFTRGGVHNSRTQIADLKARLRIVSLVEPLPKGQHVLQVEPVLGQSKYAVLVGKHEDDFGLTEWSHLKLKVVTLKNGSWSEVSAPCPTRDPREFARSVWLKPVLLDGRESRGLLVYCSYMAGDSDPCTISFFKIEERKLRPLDVFHGIWHGSILTRVGRPVMVTIRPTWKVYWPDVYEWSGGRFTFASSRHPEAYRTIPDWRGEDYHCPLWRASIEIIRKDYDAALVSLLQAENGCKLALAARRYDFSGDTKENLRDIRQRIRWIRAKDYNHWLLYRPYDFDLQVPPFKLGKAGDHR